MKTYLKMMMTVGLLMLITFAHSELWESYTRTNSPLPGNEVNAIKTDAAGDIWIATNSGLAKVSGDVWTVYTTANSNIPSNIIRAIAFHPTTGNVWLGTNNGLARFTGTNWTVYNTTNSGLPRNVVASVAIDAFGVVYAGMLAGGGLARLSGTNWTVYTANNSDLPNNYVQALGVINDNVLWAGTNNGLASFDGETWNVFNSGNSVLWDNEISCISVYGDDKIAIGTVSGGFVTIEQGVWRLIHAGIGNLPSNFIRAIDIKSNGIMWIGTELSGVGKNNNNVWSRFNEMNSGLISNEVRAIAVAADNKKWIGTTAGVSVYSGLSVTGVTVSPEAVMVFNGLSFQLSAEVIPDSAADKRVYWRSLNEEIATVNDTGYVTTISPGRVAIRAISVDGNRIGECQVNVTGTVATPTFNPPAGNYNVVLYVELSSETENTAIYYTLDESEPDQLSNLYVAPVRVAGSVVLRARAYKADWVPSAVATAVYDTPTAVEEITEDYPVAIRSNIYPNPFSLAGNNSNNNLVTVSFNANEGETVQLKLYNIRGRLLAEYRNIAVLSGNNTFNMNIGNSERAVFPPGVYFYRIDNSRGELRGKGKFSIIR